MRGLRPTATSSSSASSRSPPSSSTSTPAPLLPHPPGPGAGADVDAVPLAQRGRHLLAGEGLLAGQDPLAALDQDDLRPQRRPGLGELGADRPAAEHDHAPRNPLRGGRVAVVPGLDRVEALDRRHRGGRAGRDDDDALRDQGLLADDDAPLAVEAALAAEELDAVFAQPGLLARVVEVVDHLVAAGEDRLRVELAGHRLRDAGDTARLVQQLAGAQQRLRGHAGVVGALAADQVLLDDRDAQAAVAQTPRADLPGSTRAEHDRVEFGLAHAGNLPRLRTIDPDIARGRQASTWSVRANGCRSRLPEASLNPGTNQYVRTMSSPSLLS